VLSVCEEENSGKCICVYLAAKDEITFTGLRNYLAAHLPDYMIPTYFVKLEKIPLTINGKVDRKALPDPRAAANSLKDKEEYIPPQSEVEKKLVEVWEKVLGRTNISMNDNFFQVGGDSIKSIQIISRMNSAGYRLEMRDIFQYPIISELTPHIKKLQCVVDQSAVTGTIPLTPIQEMFFAQGHPGPHHFNQAVMFYSKDRLDKEEMKAVFTKIQEHHDALRMTYKINKENSEIIQYNHSFDYPFSLEEYEIDDQDDQTARIEYLAEKIQAGIDLEKGPMMKLGLFHLNDGDRLLIVIHHLVIDGISWRILFEDIETLCSQYKRGEKLILPAKSDSFKIWAEKLQVYANSETFLIEKNYWQKIESLEVPCPIPRDFEIENNHIKDIRNITFTLTEEETEKLFTIVNKALGTGINDILLTALAAGIKRTFGQNRILIALEGHGREEILEDINIERTVGWFSIIYPVLLDISQAHDLGQQIKEIKETLRRIPNRGIGYGILKYLTKEENKKEIQFKLRPQIRFDYLGQFDADVKQIPFFEIAKESSGNPHSLNNLREHDLYVSGLAFQQRLTMSIAYNEKAFKPGTAARLLANFEIELKQIIAFCLFKHGRN
jgi:non-ribosomal peptide synthase protein (TIGR01720 family)